MEDECGRGREWRVGLGAELVGSRDGRKQMGRRSAKRQKLEVH